jgi:hypothetical protein
MSASSDGAVMDTTVMKTSNNRENCMEILYNCLEEKLENMYYESTMQDEIRDDVKKYIEEQEIEQEITDSKQIELLYMVLQEEDQKNGEKANKDMNADANNTDEEYYKPFCIDCLQVPCTWVK